MIGIDRNPLVRSSNHRRAIDVALWMFRVVTVHCRLPDLPDRFDPAGIDILRREQRQSLVRTLVVSREELGTPLPGMVNVSEPARIAGPVLGGVELGPACFLQYNNHAI